MAHVITKQTLLDGERNLIVKATISGDGASADLASQLLIDASTYSPSSSNLKLVKVDYSLPGFSVVLEWDATTNVDIVSLSPDTDGSLSFREFGGIPNNAGAGVTGDIDVSTSGLVGEDGVIILYLQKK